MKKGFLMMLLMGGVALTASAQRGHGHGYGRGHHEDRCDDHRGRRVVYYDRGYRDYRPARVVVYHPRPVYYRPAPVVAVPVPVPAPVPVRYYPSRPRVVFNAGVTIAN
jgi:hypothetical protein